MRDFINALMLLLLVAALAYASMTGFTLYKQLKQMQQEIETLKRSVDAQAKHFEQCSFILRDDVTVGFDNYLRHTPKKGGTQ